MTLQLVHIILDYYRTEQITQSYSRKWKICHYFSRIFSRYWKKKYFPNFRYKVIFSLIFWMHFFYFKPFSFSSLLKFSLRNWIRVPILIMRFLLKRCCKNSPNGLFPQINVKAIKHVMSHLYLQQNMWWVISQICIMFIIVE